MEEPTRIELVIAVLQTAPLATWVRLPVDTPDAALGQGARCKVLSGQTMAWKAGDETRTRDIQLGKLAFYH